LRSFSLLRDVTFELTAAQSQEALMFRMLITARTLAALLLFAALPSGAQTGNGPGADKYPSKPVRMVVPLAPGGGSDIVGRIMAQALTQHWGYWSSLTTAPGRAAPSAPL
jgi:hypothetical protein